MQIVLNHHVARIIGWNSSDFGIVRRRLDCPAEPIRVGAQFYHETEKLIDWLRKIVPGFGEGHAAEIRDASTVRG